MPDRIDRRIGGNSPLLVAVLIIIAVAAAVGTYVLGSLSASPSAPVESTPVIAGQSPPSEEGITIMFVVPDDDGTLTKRSVLLPAQIGTQVQAREALVAGLADERMIRIPVLNRLKLRAFFLDESGTGFVDLAPLSDGIHASAGEELLAIYALVNTLTHNFDEIRQVRFLLDGKEASTLAGHIDLSRTFTKRMDLLRQ